MTNAAAPAARAPGSPAATAVAIPPVRLAAALACAFLPTALTALAMSGLAVADPALPAWPTGPTLAFAVYAPCNVAGVSVAYALLGRARLRALGVVLRFSWRRVRLAAAAFAAGVALFGVVDVA